MISKTITSPANILAIKKADIVELKYPFLLGISNFLPLLQGPFLFIYTSVIISKKQIFPSYHLLHGIPYLIITIFCCFDFYFLPDEEKLKYYFEIGDSPPIMYAIAFWLTVINGPIYVVLSFFKLKNHKKRIGNNFSYTDKIDLNWLKYVLLGVAIMWLIVVISKIAVEMNKNLVEIGDIPIVLIFVILVFFLGFFGFKQPVIYTDSVVKKPKTKLLDNVLNVLVGIFLLALIPFRILLNLLLPNLIKLDRRSL